MEEVIKTGLKILLIDDEERFRSALARQLSVRGCKVFEAESGEEGVEIAKEEYPDVVILDQEIPGSGMNGLEIYDEIKLVDPLIEVIMLTGHAMVEIAMRIMEKGAFDYIMKPVRIDELIYKIEDAYTRKLLNEKNKDLA